VDQQLDAFEQATEPKQIHIVKGQGHFGIYYGDGFKENIQVQLDWLKDIL
jgi:poly-beta-hydroxyalkanoate depolymerase